MAKLKYQGGITKLISSKIGQKNKLKFARYVDDNLAIISKRCAQKEVQIDIASFSSNRDFYDQVLSILSFMKYVGTPESWTLYSDGSHTPAQIKLITTGFPFLKIKKTDWEERHNDAVEVKDSLMPYKEYLVDYAQKQPLGKKLFYYLNHPIKNPTLFLDSDILFYKKASDFHMLLAEDVDGWFLPDFEWGCLDSRYKADYSRQAYQINSGFFLLKTEIPNLNEGLEFLKSLDFNYEYFSEQTTFHMLFKDNGYMPFDPRIFILNSGDQFDFGYLSTRDKIAARHYTGPVRHKMWQRDWKWHLSLD